MKKLLVMEFNELCPDLIKKFMAQGELPNFQKLHQKSVVKETETDATGTDLNPWVQWMDVHTGLERDQHGIVKLNEVSNFKGKYTWDILAEEHNVTSWICGSMNASFGSSFKGRFLPDPWTIDAIPHPSGVMDGYYNFVSKSVQGHSSKKVASPKEFVTSLFKQGLKLPTLINVAKQVLGEKISGAGTWRRAMMLDRIQLDVFRHYYQKEKPQFATFFSNAVAHYQHHYWRDFEPKKFGLDPSKIDENKKDAILLAYKNTDYLVGEIVKMVDDDCALLLVTGLSQQPFTESERYYYHMHDFAQFQHHFAIPKHVKYKPVMAEQFHLEAANEEEALAIYEQLSAYEMDGNQYFHVGTNKLFHMTTKDNMVFVQVRCTKDVEQSAMFFELEDEQEPCAFYDFFYQMDEVKAGMHNPVGLYWFSHLNGAQKIDEKRVKPSQIHQDILAYYAN